MDDREEFRGLNNRTSKRILKVGDGSLYFDNYAMPPWGGDMMH